MDFFNQAKKSSTNDKNHDSMFNKAMDAAEKYHAKEKATEYAQKRVAKRDAERNQPGYVTKDKSTFDKAREGAEDYLAKQGQKPQHQENQENKKDNQMEDLFGKAKGFLSKKH